MSGAGFRRRGVGAGCRPRVAVAGRVPTAEPHTGTAPRPFPGAPGRAVSPALWTGLVRTFGFTR
ncbi:hypothetical protein GCM10010260_51550 [Streptomyces filipinensis]|uniref:Uncharacterized protein n=1 Tax=Streptomyces filipinensis TaxID=66887 RepID=A0A918MCB3_9ACTN|nr:hypothetical protein GCM10010260_51550 [Streptomyces filipinensis]